MLSKLEQETVILFNEAEPTAEIYTHNTKLINRLAHLHKQRPEEIIQTGCSGKSVTYTCPKGWIKINPGQRLTDEQRKIRAERIKSAQFAKNSNWIGYTK